jgi:hypothetical protein
MFSSFHFSLPAIVLSSVADDYVEDDDDETSVHKVLRTDMHMPNS